MDDQPDYIAIINGTEFPIYRIGRINKDRAYLNANYIAHSILLLTRIPDAVVFPLCRLLHNENYIYISYNDTGTFLFKKCTDNIIIGYNIEDNIEDKIKDRSAKIIQREWREYRKRKAVNKIKRAWLKHAYSPNGPMMLKTQRNFNSLKNEYHTFDI